MTLNPWVYWIAGLPLAVGAIVRGSRFRRGSDQALLRVYRNPALPAIWRNGMLFVGPASLLWAPLFVISLPFLLHGGIDPSLPRSLRLVLLMGPAGYFLLVGGVTVLLASRTPERLVPVWIREDDRRVGWVRSRLDWFDLFALLVGGLGGLVLGLVFVTGAILLLVDSGIVG